MTLKCMEYDSFVTGEIFVSERERKSPAYGACGMVTLRSQTSPNFEADRRQSL